MVVLVWLLLEDIEMSLSDSGFIQEERGDESEVRDVLSLELL